MRDLRLTTTRVASHADVLRLVTRSSPPKCRLVTWNAKTLFKDNAKHMHMLLFKTVEAGSIEAPEGHHMNPVDRAHMKRP